MKSTLFRRLILVSFISTALISVLLVVSLLRLSLEVPRPYLSSRLFYALLEQTTTRSLAEIEINGKKLIVLTEDQLKLPENQRFTPLIAKVEASEKQINANDKIVPFGAVIKKFGLAAEKIDGYYYAALEKDGQYFITPPYTEPLSKTSRFLLISVFLGFIIILAGNFIALRRLTKPFSELNTAIRRMENQELDYRIDTRKTFGEYKDLSKAFNKMAAKMAQIYEARKYLLLAIAHELRSPLARLKVRKDLIDDEKLRGSIRRDINSIEQIIEAIIYTEKYLADEMPPLDTGIIVSDLLTGLANEYCAEGKTVNLKIADKDADKLIPSTRLSIVLRNLLDNAFKHGKVEKAEIAVTLSKCPQTGKSLLNFDIIDHGRGMCEENIALMTEAFWRQDLARSRETGGFGLGLYVCRIIAESLGGTIKILGAPDLGLTVTVTIPVDLSKFIS